ncbi:homeobox-leucine zipper protein [Klebsormidium nitens]|uniref:Homeobox-leucine zipper protein n=1 Tax=Klebsormidium nitens TaxID=105231 RepID=A0A1Y1HSW9_KLENI|nr:homeobox-leucine zipper protein [Klebsormidium nitens]|eukprot:GAQ81710.1 homeobox-leucine zipper protein [Klebsormidium nitens]
MSGGHGMDIDEITEGLTSPEALEELLTSLQGVPQPPPRVPSPKTPLPEWGGEPGGGIGEDPEGGEKRKRLTEAQVQELERIFQKEPTGPPTETRAAIAREFGVPQNQIASWFHNRRTRQRARQLKEDFDVMKRRLDLAYLENQQLRHELNAIRAEHANCPPLPTTSRGSATGPAATPRSGEIDITPLRIPDAREETRTAKRGGKRASPEPPSGIATLLIPKRERPFSPGAQRAPSPPQLAALPNFRSDPFRPGVSAPELPTFASQYARSLLTSPPAVPTTPFPEVSQIPASFPGVNRPARLPSILAPLPLPASDITARLTPHETPVPRTGFTAPYPGQLDPTNRLFPPALTGDMTLDEAFREVFTGGPVAVDPLDHPYPPGADAFGYSEGAPAAVAAATASFPMRAPSPSLGNWLWAVGSGSSTAGSSTSGSLMGGFNLGGKARPKNKDREGQ